MSDNRPSSIPGPAPFGTDEILLYGNGKWGDANYAIANSGGKNWTNNIVIYEVHNLVGRELQALMHMPDVRMSRPPHVKWLRQAYKACAIGLKRLRDREVGFTNPERFDPKHATPAPRMFRGYPVPYFGNRIRQRDCHEYCTYVLMLLSEMMQHSDNEYQLDVSTEFTKMARKYFQRVAYLMATKFFNKEPAEIRDPNWKGLTDQDFVGYEPASVHLDSELVEERPPVQWWPTENDLTPIRGVAYDALELHAQRWPDSERIYRGAGGTESRSPAEAANGNNTLPSIGGTVSTNDEIPPLN